MPKTEREGGRGRERKRGRESVQRQPLQLKLSVCPAADSVANIA